MRKTAMFTGRAILLGGIFCAGLIASADVFVKGPTTEELKAKNTPGKNWEGPHVPELLTMEDMKIALATSNEEPILIFKHSTTCGVCARAAYRMNKWMKQIPGEAPKMYFVKVIETRDVSDALAMKLEVIHESPQILLVQNKKLLWDTSHNDITVRNIRKGMKKIKKTKQK